MSFKDNSKQVKRVEIMLLEQMHQDGRITVRSLDKIHARTGLRYAIVSEIARRLQERDGHFV